MTHLSLIYPKTLGEETHLPLLPPIHTMKLYWKGPHFMIFGAEIRPHSPPKSDIFSSIFKKNSPTPKEKQNKQAKLNVFCLKQEIFTISYWNLLIQYKICYSTSWVLFLKADQYFPTFSKQCKAPLLEGPWPQSTIR